MRNYSRKWLFRQLQSNFQLCSWVYSIRYSLFFPVCSDKGQCISLSRGWNTSFGRCFLHPIRIIIMYRLCGFLFYQGLVVWYLTHWLAVSAAALEEKLKDSWFHSLLVTRKLIQFFSIFQSGGCSTSPLFTWVWNGITKLLLDDMFFSLWYVNKITFDALKGIIHEMMYLCTYIEEINVLSWARKPAYLLGFP